VDSPQAVSAKTLQYIINIKFKYLKFIKLKAIR